MSVIMTMRIPADPKKIEEVAAADADALRSISEKAKEHGLIAHRFYGSENEIMVIDEWPDPESFQKFFEDQREQIGARMQAVGAGEPQITFWHKLDTHDEVGWGS